MFLIPLTLLLVVPHSSLKGASQRSIEAAARVVGNQIVAYFDDPTAGNVNAADNAAARLPVPLTQDLIDIVLDFANSAGLSDDEAGQILLEMALLAGFGSDLEMVADQVAPPPATCPCFDAAILASRTYVKCVPPGATTLFKVQAFGGQSSDYALVETIPDSEECEIDTPLTSPYLQRRPRSARACWIRSRQYLLFPAGIDSTPQVEKRLVQVLLRCVSWNRFLRLCELALGICREDQFTELTIFSLWLMSAFDVASCPCFEGNGLPYDLLLLEPAIFVNQSN